jgi:hypothetical protein
VVIVLFVVLAVRGMTRAGRLPLWLLLGGLLAMALADSTYAYLVDTDRYVTGHLVDSGWVVGYLGVALAAFCADAPGAVAARGESSAPALAGLVIPFLPLVLALCVLSVQVQLGDRPDSVALMMACALVALALVRQALLVIDLIAPREGRRGSLGERLRSALVGAIPESCGRSSPARSPERVKP